MGEGESERGEEEASALIRAAAGTTANFTRSRTSGKKLAGPHAAETTTCFSECRKHVRSHSGAAGVM